MSYITINNAVFLKDIFMNKKFLLVCSLVSALGLNISKASDEYSVDRFFTQRKAGYQAKLDQDFELAKSGVISKSNEDIKALKAEITNKVPQTLTNKQLTDLKTNGTFHYPRTEYTAQVDTIQKSILIKNLPYDDWKGVLSRQGMGERTRFIKHIIDIADTIKFIIAFEYSNAEFYKEVGYDNRAPFKVQIIPSESETSWIKERYRVIIEIKTKKLQQLSDLYGQGRDLITQISALENKYKGYFLDEPLAEANLKLAKCIELADKVQTEDDLLQLGVEGCKQFGDIYLYWITATQKLEKQQSSTYTIYQMDVDAFNCKTTHEHLMAQLKKLFC